MTTYTSDDKYRNFLYFVANSKLVDVVEEWKYSFGEIDIYTNDHDVFKLACCRYGRWRDDESRSIMNFIRSLDPIYDISDMKIRTPLEVGEYKETIFREVFSELLFGGIGKVKFRANGLGNIACAMRWHCQRGDEIAVYNNIRNTKIEQILDIKNIEDMIDKIDNYLQ